MTWIIFALLFVLCLVLDAALEYNSEEDRKPNRLWHKFLRKLNSLMSSDEEEESVNA